MTTDMDVIVGGKQERDPECLIFGGLVMDCYYEIDEWPRHGQDVMLNSETYRVGGCAVNMAVTVKNLGGKASVISSVGNDEIGRKLIDYMIGHGLSSDFVKIVDEPSGKCFVFLEPDGERTFMTQKGAEGVFSEALASAAAFRRPAAAGVTGYYLLDRDADRVMDCLEKLHECGTKILFDPSPLVGEIREDLLQRILDISSVITPNNVELEVIEKIMPVELATKNGTMVVIKAGASGGTVCYGDPKLPGIMRSLEYKAEQVTAVDTTGAGDSFAGALLYAMMNDLSIRESVELAARCASKTVTIEGPHGFWTLDEE